MNTLLFRAYSKTLKKYVVEGFSFFGEWLTFDMFGQIIDENWDLFKENYDCRFLATNDFIIEQYIGRIDKNGNEIYESDIVRCKALDTMEDVVIESIIHIPMQLSWVNCYKDASIEVIGDIHNNLEFLQKGISE